MFEWKSDYSVKIQSVDEEHKVLFGLASDLNAAMAKGQGKNVLANVLDRLLKYTVAHFAHEEALMQRYRYPRLTEHKAEHMALTKKVRQVHDDLAQGRAVLTMDIMDFLQKWLTQHIQHSDMLYAVFINQRAA